MYISEAHSINSEESHHDIVTNVLDCDIILSEFKLQSF